MKEVKMKNYQGRWKEREKDEERGKWQKEMDVKGEGEQM